jgi:hypothetical protein
LADLAGEESAMPQEETPNQQYTASLARSMSTLWAPIHLFVCPKFSHFGCWHATSGTRAGGKLLLPYTQRTKPNDPHERLMAFPAECNFGGARFPNVANIHWDRWSP